MATKYRFLEIGQTANQTTNSDAKLAASLQAEAWEENPRVQADAKVAASLQVESFCKECENRVVLGGRARPEPLVNPTSRSPWVQGPLNEEVILSATQLDWKLSDYGLRQRDITGDGAC